MLLHDVVGMYGSNMKVSGRKASDMVASGMKAAVVGTKAEPEKVDGDVDIREAVVMSREQ